jgi:drug/metabolite transporter (DMT)-like permease
MKILTLIFGLFFVGIGITTGQGLLIRFARSIKLDHETILQIIMRALSTPYLYGAVLVYFLAVMTYLYISRIVSFTSLNISLIGVIILVTLCADYFLFKENLNWAHIAGAVFTLCGVGFMLFASKTSGAL